MATTYAVTEWKSPKNVTYSKYGEYCAEWSYLNNVKTRNGSGAVLPSGEGINKSRKTAYLVGYNYGLAVPSSATVVGIEVRITKKKVTNGGTAKDYLIALRNGSTDAPRNISRNFASGSLWSKTYTAYTYGGSRDKLGANLTPAVVNSSTFGVNFRAIGTVSTYSNIGVDCIEIRVHYAVTSDTVKPPVVTPPTDPDEPPVIVIPPNDDVKVTDWHYPSVINQYQTWINPYKTYSSLSSTNSNVNFTNEANGSATPTFVSVGSHVEAPNTSGSWQECKWYVKNNFGFNIPSDAKITGLQVDIYYGTSSENQSPIQWELRLCKPDGTYGVNGCRSHYASTANTFKWVWYTIGGSTDLWGTTWTPADINSSNFKFKTKGGSLQPSRSLGVGAPLKVTVYYQDTDGVAWSQISNVLNNCDTSTATTVTLAQNQISQQLIGQGYGFDIKPNSKIVGIEAKMVRKSSVDSTISDYGTVLYNYGTYYNYNTDHTPITVSTTLTTNSFGGSGFVWGQTATYWTPEKVNSSAFGLDTVMKNTSATTATLSLYCMAIRIYYIPERKTIQARHNKSITTANKFYENIMPIGVANCTDTSILTKTNCTLESVDDPTGSDNKVYKLNPTGTSGSSYVSLLAKDAEVEKGHYYLVSYEVYVPSDTGFEGTAPYNEELLSYWYGYTSTNANYFFNGAKPTQTDKWVKVSYIANIKIDGYFVALRFWNGFTDTSKTVYYRNLALYDVTEGTKLVNMVDYDTYKSKNTNDWGSVGASVSVSDEWSTDGTTSIKTIPEGLVTNERSFFYFSKSIIAGEEYTSRIKFKGKAGLSYTAYFIQNATPYPRFTGVLASKTWIASGETDTIEITGICPDFTVPNPVVVIASNQISTDPFYVAEPVVYLSNSIPVDAVFDYLGNACVYNAPNPKPNYDFIDSYVQSIIPTVKLSTAPIILYSDLESIEMLERPNQIRRELGYIGTVTVERGHHYDTITRKNTLIKESASGATNWSKNGVIEETRPLTIRVPKRTVKTLEGLIDLQGIVPVDTVISMADNDPYAQKGYAILSEIKHKRINEAVSECDITADYVTKNLKTPLTVDYLVKTVPPLNANIITDTENALFYLENGDMKDIELYCTNGGMVGTPTITNTDTGLNIELKANDTLMYVNKDAVNVPCSFMWKFDFNKTSNDSFKVEPKIRNADDANALIGTITVSNSVIKINTSVGGTKTLTTSIPDSASYTIVCDIDATNMITLTVDVDSGTSTNTYTTTISLGNIVNLRSAIQPSNNNGSATNTFKFTGMGVTKKLFTDNIDTSLRNIIHLPKPLGTNIPCDFIRKTAEGDLYSYINPTREILFTIDPSRFFDTSVKLFDYTGTRLLSTDMVIDNQKEITLENGVFKAVFDIPNNKISIYGFLYGWIYLGTLTMLNMFHVKPITISFDMVQLQVGETKWTLRRGKPFIEISHPYDDFGLHGNFTHYWHDNGGGIGVIKQIEQEEEPLNVNTLFYCNIYNQNSNIGMQIFRPQLNNLMTNKITKSTETGIGWYNKLAGENERHYEIALEYLAKSNQDIYVYLG